MKQDNLSSRHFKMIKITSPVAWIMRTLWLIVAALVSGLSGRYLLVEVKQEDDGMNWCHKDILLSVWFEHKYLIYLRIAYLGQYYIFFLFNCARAPLGPTKRQWNNCFGWIARANPYWTHIWYCWWSSRRMWSWLNPNYENILLTVEELSKK